MLGGRTRGHGCAQVTAGTSGGRWGLAGGARPGYLGGSRAGETPGLRWDPVLVDREVGGGGGRPFTEPSGRGCDGVHLSARLPVSDLSRLFISCSSCPSVCHLPNPSVCPVCQLCTPSVCLCLSVHHLSTVSLCLSSVHPVCPSVCLLPVDGPPGVPVPQFTSPSYLPPGPWRGVRLLSPR